MKKKLLIVAMLILFLIGCSSEKQEKYSGESEMEVVNSRNMTSSNYYSQELIVILNRSEVVDYEECAREIIKHCIQNDFHSTKFSYDVQGYPNELKATVFLSQEDRENENILFEMFYEADSYEYNIKDNQEQFELEIKKDFD